MAPRARDRLLAAAEDLFYRDGFHAVGLDRILAETEVTKTTFYNHFESKEDLIVEVLRARDPWWRKIFAERLRERAGDDPARQLHAIFDVLDEFIAADTFNGCMFGERGGRVPATPRARAPSCRPRSPPADERAVAPTDAALTERGATHRTDRSVLKPPDARP
jgi:AcrR family transcriptional regulator